MRCCAANRRLSRARPYTLGPTALPSAPLAIALHAAAAAYSLLCLLAFVLFSALRGEAAAGLVVFAVFTGLAVSHGVLAPAGVPEANLARLASAFRAGVAHPEIQERLRALGFTPISDPAASYAENLQGETEKWARVVREANVKLD